MYTYVIILAQNLWYTNFCTCETFRSKHNPPVSVLTAVFQVIGISGFPLSFPHPLVPPLV